MNPRPRPAPSFPNIWKHLGPGTWCEWQGLGALSREGKAGGWGPQGWLLHCEPGDGSGGGAGTWICWFGGQKKKGH